MKATIRKSTLVVLALLCAGITFSQTKKKVQKKAEKELDEYAYIDARDTYLQLVEDSITSAQIYKFLGDTYYWNSDYKESTKWYQRLINEYPAKADSIYTIVYYRTAQYLKVADEATAERYMQAYANNGGDTSIVRAAESTGVYEFDAELQKVKINTTYSDFGVSFYGEDKVVFSTAADSTAGAKTHDWNNQPYLDLYVASMDEDGELYNPQRLMGDINTAYHESNAVFTNDGNTVYFTRNHFIDGKKGKDKEKTLRLKLYKASKGESGSWSDVTKLEIANDPDSVSFAHPALSIDEKKLYFASDMEGTRGFSDLWYVDINEDGSFGIPKNLGDNLNTGNRESFPFISEKYLYFASDGRGGLGGYDIYRATLDTNGMPSDIVSLGEPVNSRDDDFAFIFNEETKRGFLSSNRDGYQGGSLDDEIYRVREIECIAAIVGTVYDKKTKEILPGALVTLLDADNKPMEEVISDSQGRFSFVSPATCESQYAVRASKDLAEYEPDEKRAFTGETSGTVVVDLFLDPPCDNPYDLGCELELLPIYFDFDRHNIREDAATELSKILVAMRQYPELVIHIESHTDSRGNDSYNENLSEKRAQSTLNWLVDQGIDRSRLSAKGYGESRLKVEKCTNGAECTEEEHQLNRRSMFIIQN